MSADLINRLRELAAIADRDHLLQGTASESLRDAAAAIEAQEAELVVVSHGTSLLHDAWLTKWNKVSIERDAARATLAEVQKYADERAWYGSLNRTVGSNRIASDLLAILSGCSQGATEAEPWSDPNPWLYPDGCREDEPRHVDEYTDDHKNAVRAPRTRAQYEAEEAQK